MLKNLTDKTFENIIDTIREPLLVLDQDLRVVTVSRSFYDFFKVKPEETVGQLIYDLGNKQWDIPKLRELLENILPEKTAFDNYEVEHDFATIGKRIMLLNARQIEQGMGKERIILLAIEDITERKKIDAGLEKTRKELEVIKKSADEAHEFADSIINTVREPLISLDQDLRVVTVSRSFYDFFKVKPEETVGQLIYDLGNKQWDIPKLRELLENILPEKTAFDNYEVEHDFTTIGKRIMLLNARQIEQGVGKERIILLAIEDITERKMAESIKDKLDTQKRQLHKAESLSRMAGAIAHNFNNQLFVVMGNLELALNNLPDDAKTHRFLNEAMKATQRSSKISGLMLTYLGQSTIKLEALNFSEVCRHILPLFHDTIQKKITLETDFMVPGSVVASNPNQIKIVLTNLITNSLEAIGDRKGEITLKTKIIPASDIPNIHIAPADWQADNDIFACLEVKDTGCGISDENIYKIFDPFFTTKFIGRGLGLPVVLGIVKTWKGAVSAESRKDHGSIFRIFLPLSTDEISRQSEKVIGTDNIEKHGTVLLIDDQDLVRKMVGSILKHLGFSVLEAAGGIEGLELFAQHQKKIRCVITDLTMPEMDGWETLMALRKIQSNLPVILVSGYDEDQAMERFNSEKPQAFLRKPFSMAELEKALNKSL